MKKPAITPGPWRVDGRPDDLTIRSKAWGKSDMMGDSRGVIIADFVKAHGNRPHAVPEAITNAQAISAVPEMLDALIDVKRFYDSVALPETVAIRIEHTMRRVESALKKAGVEL